VSSIDKLLHMLIHPIPLVVMSATITQHNIDPLFCILGISPSNAKVFWMPMNRRTIFFDVSVLGNPTVSVRSAVVSDYRYWPNSVIGHGIGGKVIPAKMARLAESQSLE
jgi:hypothetical protein